MTRRTRSGGGGRRGSFTLVELLVVMAIIVTLAGLTIVGISQALEYSHLSAERHTISMLKLSIHNFSLEWGAPPPTSLRYFQLKSINRINEGNESLFACLETRKRKGPFVEDLDESRWMNTDNDVLTPADLKKIQKNLDWTRPGNKLLEYTDFWGNPYAYIHSDDYDKKFQYKDSQGQTFEVQAAKSEKTGGHAAHDSYQLWSLGPDGINQGGHGDDICSWKS